MLCRLTGIRRCCFDLCGSFLELGKYLLFGSGNSAVLPLCTSIWITVTFILYHDAPFQIQMLIVFATNAGTPRSTQRGTSRGTLWSCGRNVIAVVTKKSFIYFLYFWISWTVSSIQNWNCSVKIWPFWPSQRNSKLSSWKAPFVICRNKAVCMRIYWPFYRIFQILPVEYSHCKHYRKMLLDNNNLLYNVRVGHSLTWVRPTIFVLLVQ